MSLKEIISLHSQKHVYVLEYEKGVCSTDIIQHPKIQFNSDVGGSHTVMNSMTQTLS